MDWLPQGIRFVLYPAAPGSLPEAHEVWKRALPDREAQTIQRAQATAPGISQSLASGVVRGLNLTFTVQPMRLDILAGRTDAWISDQRPLSLDELLTPALVYGKKCVEAYDCTRVALALDLVADATGWEDAAAKFRTVVPSLELPAATREVTLTLNPARAFTGAPDLTMNRLCKWETALVQLMLLQAQMNSMGMTPAGPAIPSQTRYVLAASFDLSSEIRAVPLERAVAATILEELGAEQRLLVAEGYQRLSR